MKPDKQLIMPDNTKFNQIPLTHLRRKKKRPIFQIWGKNIGICNFQGIFNPRLTNFCNTVYRWWLPPLPPRELEKRTPQTSLIGTTV